ncbi:MAG TPA: SdrD B-like domain-containing protein [Pirellulales bacterium]|nr:SdrD B-like domain-containing protein [Pirellulales bacterium]
MRWFLTSNPIVTVDTNFGNFQLELFPADAPQTVANFLSYVDSGKYTDAVFSRSVANFVVQAGGITSTSATYTSNSQFVPVAQNAAIPLEYKLPNTAGTIAMARSSSPNSATDEWFINTVDNSTNLGPGGVDANGYAVFGQVIGNGMQVIDTIAALSTKNEGSVQTSTSSSTDLSNLPLGPNNKLVQITSMTVDSVDGNVYNDANGNGQADTGEVGVAGRTVFVDVDGTGKPDSNNPSVVTDAEGNYSITGVKAGSFVVREVLPSGVGLTTPLQTVTFAANQTSLVFFGEGPAITGTVFSDLNDNGKLDTGETGVAGRTVFLNNDGTGKPDSSNPSTTTDANGHFSFSGLASGTYKVAEVQPTNVNLSTNTQAIVVTANAPAVTANIGELPSIVGTVFNDLNDNGKLDSGEPGLPGVTVFVNEDGTGKPDSSNPSTTTDANGRFIFSGLSAGSYTVEEVIPTDHGVTLTTPFAAVTVGSSQLPTVNIGNALTSTIVPLPVGSNPPTPSSNGNTSYIDNLYYTVLGRQVDQATLSYWQQQLSGGITRDSVAQAVWNSTEHRTDQVDQFYHTFLGRAPEAAGESYWVNTYNSWGNEKTLVLNFVTVPEYQHLHVSNSDFVTALYNDVAQRPADSSGLAFWQSALNGGESRLQVAQTFVNGQEASTRAVDSFFADFLHRAADSTTQGMITNLEQGKASIEATAVSVLASNEYFNLSGKI